MFSELTFRGFHLLAWKQTEAHQGALVFRESLMPKKLCSRFDETFTEPLIVGHG